MPLHWILVLTMTLLNCFTANPIPVNFLVKDIERTIGELQEGVCNEPDSTFYSPSGTNGCTIKALQCSVLELQTVGTECFESKPEMSQLVSRTRDTIKYMLKARKNTELPDFKDCFCGNEGRRTPEVKSYQEFLENLRKLVQMVNSSDSVAA